MPLDLGSLKKAVDSLDRALAAPFAADARKLLQVLDGGMIKAAPEQLGLIRSRKNSGKLSSASMKS